LIVNEEKLNLDSSSNTRSKLASRKAQRQNNSVDFQKNAYLFGPRELISEKIWHFSNKPIQLNKKSFNLVAA
jgi:hypothetical protein